MKKRWIQIKTMTTERSGVKAVGLEDKLFVLGSWNKQMGPGLRHDFFKTSSPSIFSVLEIFFRSETVDVMNVD